ncbi:MAG: ABC transporter permease [Vicinamibacterales bacterium]
MWTLWQDLRYSVRLFIKQPAFTLTAVGILTLGIGVNAGIFGLINGMLLRPLPGADADGELVGVYSHAKHTERGYRGISYPDFDDIRAAGGPFLRLAAHNAALVGVFEGNTTRQGFVDIISTGYFEALGVQPALGRVFSRDEERPGSRIRAVIVSHLYWQRTGFAADILTRTVRINGQDYGIIGVAPKGFGGTTAILGAEFFLPLGAHDDLENDFDSREHRQLADRQAYSLVVIGRLKPGVTREQADQQLVAIATGMEEALPVENRERELLVRPLGRMGISTSPMNDSQLIVPVTLLQGLAGAVLLIACLNLANMMLASGAARQKEIAIRLAVGAGRAQIVRQFLVQGFLLSLAGGAAGLVVATWSMQVLVSSITTVLPIAITLDATPDLWVALATLVFCALATIGFGLWPALKLSRTDVAPTLKDQAGEVSGRIGRRVTVRGALLTAQMALSLALLIVSGLFVRGAAAGASADPGFRLEPIVIAELDPRLAGADASRAHELRRAVLERLRGTPGIDAAATASVLPFGDVTIGSSVQREGPRLKREDPDAKGKLAEALQYVVSADYFRALGLAMLRGREFTAAEETGPTGRRPVIIDAALAAKLFAADDPIGRVLQFGADSGGAGAQPMEIVGVAPTVRHDLFEREPEPHLYLPSGNTNPSTMFTYVRASAPVAPVGMVTTVRDQLQAVDAGLPILSVKSFAARHNQSATMWMLRSAAKLFLALGLAAAFVAIVGLYGVNAYMVSRRTREIGVRMAVGAAPADVLRLVVREASSTTGAGLLIGLGLGALLGRVMSAMLYGVSPFDPASLAGASALLGTASLAATLVTARRAARVSPMAALRDS